MVADISRHLHHMTFTWRIIDKPDALPNCEWVQLGVDRYLLTSLQGHAGDPLIPGYIGLGYREIGWPSLPHICPLPGFRVKRAVVLSFLLAVFRLF